MRAISEKSDLRSKNEAFVFLQSKGFGRIPGSAAMGNQRLLLQSADCMESRGHLAASWCGALLPRDGLHEIGAYCHPAPVLTAWLVPHRVTATHRTFIGSVENSRVESVSEKGPLFYLSAARQQRRPAHKDITIHSIYRISSSW